jgi:hypothetical protein
VIQSFKHIAADSSDDDDGTIMTDIITTFTDDLMTIIQIRTVGNIFF